MLLINKTNSEVKTS